MSDSSNREKAGGGWKVRGESWFHTLQINIHLSYAGLGVETEHIPLAMQFSCRGQEEGYMSDRFSCRYRGNLGVQAYRVGCFRQTLGPNQMSAESSGYGAPRAHLDCPFSRHRELIQG